jgi:hypothetical protein
MTGDLKVNGHRWHRNGRSHSSCSRHVELHVGVRPYDDEPDNGQLGAIQRKSSVHMHPRLHTPVLPPRGGDCPRHERLSIFFNSTRQSCLLEVVTALPCVCSIINKQVWGSIICMAQCVRQLVLLQWRSQQSSTDTPSSPRVDTRRPIRATPS